MKSTRHAKYNINYHFVWIPKYRRPILSNIKEELEIVLKDIAKSKGLEILSLEIQPDHIHLFVSSPPVNSPALLANWFKGISARVINYEKKSKVLKWTRSYYVGTAGNVSAETIKKYIEEQTNASKKDSEL